MSNRSAAKHSLRQSFATTESSSNSEGEERLGESELKALIKPSSKKKQPVGKPKQTKKQKLVEEEKRAIQELKSEREKNLQVSHC